MIITFIDNSKTLLSSILPSSLPHYLSVNLKPDDYLLISTTENNEIDSPAGVNVKLNSSISVQSF